MRGGELDGLLQIGQGLRYALSGQPMHQIQIETAQRQAGSLTGCGDGLGRIVDASQRLELLGVEALDAYADPVHAGSLIGSKAACFHGPRIGLHGDLDMGGKGDARRYPLQQPAYGVGAKQAGGATTDKDGIQLPSCYRVQLLLQILEQGADIALLIGILFEGMGVEIAVGTLLHTPGDMDVERQGRQGQQAGHAQKISCSFSIISFSALARWLLWFLMSGGSWAAVQPVSGTKKTGS